MYSKRTAWMRRVDDVLAVWRDVRTVEEHEFLRDFHGVLKDAPEPELVPGLAVSAPKRFHNLLEVRAYESAVLELLSPASGHLQQPRDLSGFVPTA
jgi:hypothetical protein